mmetsp:Transcript_67197/g.93551  ORF Transcript_67197/g.93551 Transcript_67197/m.93551 type:complete len:200 (-) Transcript_67197:51-650(-)
MRDSTFAGSDIAVVVASLASCLASGSFFESFFAVFRFMLAFTRAVRLLLLLCGAFDREIGLRSFFRFNLLRMEGLQRLAAVIVEWSQKLLESQRLPINQRPSLLPNVCELLPGTLLKTEPCVATNFMGCSHEYPAFMHHSNNLALQRRRSSDCHLSMCDFISSCIAQSLRLAFYSRHEVELVYQCPSRVSQSTQGVAAS